MCGAEQTTAVYSYVQDKNKPEAERKFDGPRNVNGLDLIDLGLVKHGESQRKLGTRKVVAKKRGLHAPTLGTPPRARPVTKKTMLTGA